MYTEDATDITEQQCLKSGRYITRISMSKCNERIERRRQQCRTRWPPGVTSRMLCTKSSCVYSHKRRLWGPVWPALFLQWPRALRIFFHVFFLVRPHLDKFDLVPSNCCLQLPTVYSSLCAVVSSCCLQCTALQLPEILFQGLLRSYMSKNPSIDFMPQILP
jgi:hypothetical protein